MSAAWPNPFAWQAPEGAAGPRAWKLPPSTPHISAATPKVRDLTLPPGTACRAASSSAASVPVPFTPEQKVPLARLLSLPSRASVNTGASDSRVSTRPQVRCPANATDDIDDEISEEESSSGPSAMAIQHHAGPSAPESVGSDSMSDKMSDVDRMEVASQASHVSKEWSADPWVGNTFVGFNLVFQVIPCLILLINGAITVPKWAIQVCIAVLIIVVLAQSVA